MVYSINLLTGRLAYPTIGGRSVDEAQNCVLYILTTMVPTYQLSGVDSRVSKPVVAWVCSAVGRATVIIRTCDDSNIHHFRIYQNRAMSDLSW